MKKVCRIIELADSIISAKMMSEKTYDCNCKISTSCQIKICFRPTDVFFVFRPQHVRRHRRASDGDYDSTRDQLPHFCSDQQRSGGVLSEETEYEAGSDFATLKARIPEAAFNRMITVCC